MPERLDEKVLKLPILHPVRSSPSLFRDKQFLAVSRPKAPSRGDTTSIELVLYRQHHFHKRLYGHSYFRTHFWICRPVSCGGYDDVKGTASPPDHLSYPSSSIVTCNTHGSVSRGSDGNLSYTSVSCSAISSVLRH